MPPASCPRARPSVGLEDKFRPHFFSGVATVVGKLLIQCEPDFALFGEKDFQQLKVVTQMARDLGAARPRSSACRSCARSTAWRCPRATATCRRRARRGACAAPRARANAPSAIATGKPIGTVLRHGREALTKVGFVLDYLEARDAETLVPVGTSTSGKIRLLVAARIGGTRLIDNVGV